jgi:hypothetical protein
VGVGTDLSWSEPSHASARETVILSTTDATISHRVPGAERCRLSPLGELREEMTRAGIMITYLSHVGASNA